MPVPARPQIYIGTAGPFTKRGTYRVRVVLYDGFQPMEAAPGGAHVHSWCVEVALRPAGNSSTQSRSTTLRLV